MSYVLMPKIFQGYFRCVVCYQCHIFCPYCILHWAQSNSCSKSNAVCFQDKLFVCSAVLLQCFLVPKVFISQVLCRHTLSVSPSCLLHREKGSLNYTCCLICRFYTPTRLRASIRWKKTKRSNRQRYRKWSS